ncbi:hypothetical protein B0J13DRAFT_29655 [Dactylonectria estremocensis]|uniref:Uncharacterized protein n=1 Tax=Dactylonectria estremocensis TaxID=1079267 RepID=A0A9P9JLG5_9HYPO|nr:hypothetical protein B0J13DRAFT_29655 [Dactylonectria estremocensis]
MHFSFALVAITAAAANALAPASQLITGFSNITAITQGLIAPASKISSNNMGLFLKGRGPVTDVVAGLSKVVQLSTKLVSDPSSSSAETDPGASPSEILGSAVHLTSVTTELLNTLSKKGKLFSRQHIVSVPVHGVLISTKNAVSNLLTITLNSLTSGPAATDGTLANATPSLATTQAAIDSLNDAFRNAIAATRVNRK